MNLRMIQIYRQSISPIYEFIKHKYIAHFNYNTVKAEVNFQTLPQNPDFELRYLIIGWTVIIIK